MSCEAVQPILKLHLYQKLPAQMTEAEGLEFGPISQSERNLPFMAPGCDSFNTKMMEEIFFSCSGR